MYREKGWFDSGACNTSRSITKPGRSVRVCCFVVALKTVPVSLPGASSNICMMWSIPAAARANLPAKKIYSQNKKGPKGRHRYSVDPDDKDPVGL